MEKENKKLEIPISRDNNVLDLLEFSKIDNFVYDEMGLSVEETAETILVYTEKEESELTEIIITILPNVLSKMVTDYVWHTELVIIRNNSSYYLKFIQFGVVKLSMDFNSEDISLYDDTKDIIIYENTPCIKENRRSYCRSGIDIIEEYLGIKNKRGKFKRDNIREPNNICSDRKTIEEAFNIDNIPKNFKIIAIKYMHFVHIIYIKISEKMRTACEVILKIIYKIMDMRDNG